MEALRKAVGEANATLRAFYPELQPNQHYSLEDMIGEHPVEAGEYKRLVDELYRSFKLSGRGQDNGHLSKGR